MFTCTRATAKIAMIVLFIALSDSSGYTQFGRAYLSLQSAVSSERFIEGYTRAAALTGLEYTPVVNGTPSLFEGGAAFPGNDWVVSPGGEEYLSRIPPGAHRPLARIRAFHLDVTREVVRQLKRHDKRPFEHAVSFSCRDRGRDDGNVP